MTMTQLVEAYRSSTDPNRRRAIRRTLRRQAEDLTVPVARSVQLGPNVTVTVRPSEDDERQGYASVDVHQFGELMIGLSWGEMDDHDAIRTFARIVTGLL